MLDWARRILSDCESLQQEASELREGLVGRLRLGVIPTTLPMISALTSPFALKHPQVVISVLSLSSIDIQRGLDDFSLDAGLTYLENEPLSNVRTVPLYDERYFLFTPARRARSAGRHEVTWRDAADVPLCLLTPDMQNRRIVNGHFREAGVDVRPHIETNSMVGALLASPIGPVVERPAADLPSFVRRGVRLPRDPAGAAGRRRTRSGWSFPIASRSPRRPGACSPSCPTPTFLAGVADAVPPMGAARAG